MTQIKETSALDKSKRSLKIVERLLKQVRNEFLTQGKNVFEYTHL
jgi:hypothetical protein